MGNYKISSVAVLYFVLVFSDWVGFVFAATFFTYFVGSLRFYAKILLGFLFYHWLVTVFKGTISIFITDGSIKKNSFVFVFCRPKYLKKSKVFCCCSVFFLFTILLSILAIFPWFLTVYSRDHTYLSLEKYEADSCVIGDRLAFNNQSSFIHLDAFIESSNSSNQMLSFSGFACLTEKETKTRGESDFYGLGVELRGSETILLEDSKKQVIILPPFWSCLEEEELIDATSSSCYFYSYTGEKETISFFDSFTFAGENKTEEFLFPGSDDSEEEEGFSDGFSDGESGKNFIKNGEIYFTILNSNHTKGELSRYSVNGSLNYLDFMSIPSFGLGLEDYSYYPGVTSIGIYSFFFPIAMHWLIQLVSLVFGGVLTEFIKTLITKKQKERTFRYTTSKFRAFALIILSVLWLFTCIALSVFYYFYIIIFPLLPCLVYFLFMMANLRSLRFSIVLWFKKSTGYFYKNVHSIVESKPVIEHLSSKSICCNFLILFLLIIFFLPFMVSYTIYKVFFHIAICKSYQASTVRMPKEEVEEEVARNRKFFFALLFEIVFGVFPTMISDLVILFQDQSDFIALIHFILSFYLFIFIYPLLKTRASCYSWSQLPCARNLVLFPKDLVDEFVENSIQKKREMDEEHENTDTLDRKHEPLSAIICERENFIPSNREKKDNLEEKKKGKDQEAVGLNDVEFQF